MKILLDECLPKDLKREFPGHDVRTVPEVGWAGKTNGELLALAAGDFDLFVTADQRMQFQINLAKLKIAILVLYVGNLQLETLQRIMPAARKMLEQARAGKILQVKA
jgi:predicted nuclease of predicted toxin-antitoxin system